MARGDGADNEWQKRIRHLGPSSESACVRGKSHSISPPTRHVRLLVKNRVGPIFLHPKAVLKHSKRNGNPPPPPVANSIATAKKAGLRTTKRPKMRANFPKIPLKQSVRKAISIFPNRSESTERSRFARNDPLPERRTAFGTTPKKKRGNSFRKRRRSARKEARISKERTVRPNRKARPPASLNSFLPMVPRLRWQDVRGKRTFALPVRIKSPLREAATSKRPIRDSTNSFVVTTIRKIPERPKNRSTRVLFGHR